MDMTQLETFLAVISEGSFSRAAQRLRRTQPAVSQAIQRLEESIGEQLFDRSSRDGNLTDAGHALQDYAEKILNLRSEAVRNLADLRELQHGRLLIAANEFTSLYLVRILQDYRRLHPMIHITVQRSLGSRIAQQVLNHQVELGVLSFRPNDPDLRSVIVYRDKLVFIVNPHHPLAREKQIDIRRLGTESFVAHNVPSPYRARVVEAFQRYRTPLNMDVELPTLEAIKRFVAAGSGVALLPSIAVETELARGDLVCVEVRELSFERRLRLAYRKGAVLSHAAQALLKLMERRGTEDGNRFLFRKERS